MKPFRLLVTKKLAHRSSEQSASENVVITEKEFISIVEVRTESIRKEILAVLRGENAIIFTSKNSVAALKDFAGELSSSIKIFCLQGATQEQVIKYYGKEKISGTGKDAAELADRIIESDNNNLVFFCGNKRRDELPAILSAKQIKLKEVVVYETKLTPHPLNEEFDGICFFSPSAAESFFSMNTIGNSTACFSIGETTTASLKKYTGNKIHTAKNSSETSMLELVNSFVKNNNGKIEE